MLLSSGAEKTKWRLSPRVTLFLKQNVQSDTTSYINMSRTRLTILTSRQEIPSYSFSLILMLNLKIILLEAKSEMFSVIDETATERNRRKLELKWTVCNITVNFRPRALITIILRLQHQI